MKWWKGWRMSRAHSPTFPSLHLCHNSFSNPSIALPTSQLIPQPFCCFTYVTAHSPTLLSLFLRHRLFTYVTWRANPWLKLGLCGCFSFCTLLVCTLLRHFHLKFYILVIIIWQQYLGHRVRWIRGKARDSHSEGPGFKTRGRPNWLWFLVVS